MDGGMEMRIASSDGSFGMEHRWPTTLYVVWFGNYTPVWIAFDQKSAEDFRDAENDEAQADIMSIDEVVLVDDYGFHCRPAERAILGTLGHFEGWRGGEVR